MKTLILVDNDVSVRTRYERMLRGHGYNVRGVASMGAALRTLEDEQVDCIIMEVHLPGEDGLEALAKIRQIDRRLPVVVNSAYAAYRDDFRSWLADAYLVKNVDDSRLLAAVDDLLAEVSEAVQESSTANLHLNEHGV